jgi:amino acid adenylation domain-containing protein
VSEPCALHQDLERNAEAFSDEIAVEEVGGSRVRYRDLAALSDRARDRLRRMGVGPGDRVGVYLRKSIDSVATIFGILKAGAAYVPVDPGAPARRNAYILNDCSVRVAVVEEGFAGDLVAEISQLGPVPSLLRLDGVGGGVHLAAALDRGQRLAPAPETPTARPAPEDLAYILYTSGSTGNPKGVTLSHRAARGFVDWCTRALGPRAGDRFSSHAPFHFDLSIHDIYVPLKHAGTLVLFGEEIGKQPARLAQAIEEHRVSVWYSTPSILSLLTQYGKLAERDLSSLRVVLFAGEVFPVKHLRELKRQVPKPRFFNLYGPTETNVCTYYEIPEQIPEARAEPYPIGRVCEHLRAVVLDESMRPVAPGAEGELCIAGSNVMSGYWNLPENDARAFVQHDGERWYRTGDVVVEASDGNHTYVSRRDRMVKRRGYRVELGEIEAALYRHPDVKEAAVVATPDPEEGIRIRAFVSTPGVARPSLIGMKRFCAEALPAYMVPDLFAFLDELPKTSTDKIDYQALKAMG